MASGAPVYITGVGCSPAGRDVLKSMVSAATKALLDAGVTYNDVAHGIGYLHAQGSNRINEAFDAFEKGGIPVDESEHGQMVEHALTQISKHDVQCILLIAAEKSTSVALVLVSDNFLWRHPYLKDSAVLLANGDVKATRTQNRTDKSLKQVCEIVWALRGWTQPHDQTTSSNKSGYTTSSGQHLILSRADGNSIPEWKQVEHRQDGKHRLGYNPATETKDTSQEDFDAVRSNQTPHGRGDHTSWFRSKGGDLAALAKL